MPSNSENIQKLRDENKDLVNQVGNLREELKTLQDKISTNDDLQTSAEFFSKEYDEFKTANVDLARIDSKLNAIANRADEIEEAIELITRYSYQYNIKILGIPQLSEHETAEESIQICLNLFKELGANVDEKDIDIAHRSRSKVSPSPIICKFTRRIAKESVMSKRKKVNDIDLTKVVTNVPSSSTSKLAIFDHLTPKQTKLLHQTKSFQKENNFAFCWTKNQDILLKETVDSRPIKINSTRDLERLKVNIFSSTITDSDPDTNFPAPSTAAVSYRGAAWRGMRGGFRGSRGGPNLRPRSQTNKQS